MANVKDLIVRGGARVIGKTYLNDTDISGPVSGDYVDETTLTASEDHIPSSQAVLSALSNVSVAVTSTYSSTGTDAVNGKAVKAALDTLSVASAGGSASYITTISETGGKISATAAAVGTTYSSTGTTAVSGKAIKAALDTLSVAAAGGSGSYITTISESGGKISATAAAFPASLPASNTVSTYASNGTAPVNGTAVKAAIDTLSVAAAGGAASYITTISESGGKISATAAAVGTTYSSTGTTAVSGKSIKAALDTLSVASPTASTATSTTFIDTVSQSGGKITATKKTIPTATASVEGITKVGASGGAASYSHTHSDYASTSHTHTSLASSVDAGAANKPVYIADGVPTAATYTTPVHYTEVDSTSTATAFTATVSTLSNLAAYEDGLRVWVYNNVIASASGCKLDINGLGAKPMCRSNGLPGLVTTQWAKGTMYEFMYSSTVVSGGGWIMMMGYDTNTTYAPYSLGFGYGVCDTAAATVAKTATISNYTLAVGGIVSIRFSHDVCANATLNIRTRGAKSIYYNNAPIVEGVIMAGDTATFIYNGTNYYLIAIDKGSASPGTFYGRCDTASNTLVKVVTTAPSFRLIDGAHIFVRFTNDVNLTFLPPGAFLELNVNSTGAKSIKDTRTNSSLMLSTNEIMAGDVAEFIYDATNNCYNFFGRNSTDVINPVKGSMSNFETLTTRYSYNMGLDATNNTSTHNLLDIYANASGDCYSIIDGNHNILSTELSPDGYIEVTGNSNVVFGKSDGVINGDNNIISGYNNSVNNSNNSFVVGRSNSSYVSNSIVTGHFNKSGTSFTNPDDYHWNGQEYLSTYMSRIPDKLLVLTSCTPEYLLKNPDYFKRGLYAKTAAQVNVRQTASTSGSVVKVLDSDKWVKIVGSSIDGTNNYWWKVVCYESGDSGHIIGYIVAAYVSSAVYCISYDAFVVGGGYTSTEGLTPIVIRTDGSVLTDGPIRVSAFSNPKNNVYSNGDSEFAFVVGNAMNEGRKLEIEDSSGYSSSTDGASVTAGLTYSGDMYLTNKYGVSTNGGSPLVSVMNELNLLHNAVAPRIVYNRRYPARYVDVDVTELVNDKGGAQGNNVFAYLVTLVRWSAQDSNGSLFLLCGLQQSAYAGLIEIKKGTYGPAAAYTKSTKKLSIDFGTTDGGAYSIIPLMGSHMDSELEVMSQKWDKNIDTDADTIEW